MEAKKRHQDIHQNSAIARSVWCEIIVIIRASSESYFQ